MGDVDLVKNIFLFALVENCTLLSKVDISYSSLITDGGKKCTNITDLRLGGDEITDVSMFTIAEHLTHLNYLSV